MFKIQRLEVICEVRRIYVCVCVSLGAKELNNMRKIRENNYVLWD